MFLFLKSFRATLIPAIAVPVVLLGTFAILNIFGYTINTLTMFALVLAIGLLVDDAHLALNDGTTFGKEGEGFMRLNVACPRATLEKALKQLEQAVMDLK
jgi:multidrug efflux pump subunit AcrB